MANFNRNDMYTVYILDAIADWEEEHGLKIDEPLKKEVIRYARFDAKHDGYFKPTIDKLCAAQDYLSAYVSGYLDFIMDFRKMAG